MSVDGNDLLVIADVTVLSSPANNISKTVDLNFVETDLFHFLLDAHDYFLLLAALTGMRDHRAKKCGHFFLVTFSSLFDSPVIKFHGLPPYWIGKK